MKPTYKMWTSGQLKMYKSTQHLQALVLLQNQENSKIKRKGEKNNHNKFILYECPCYPHIKTISKF